MAGSRPCRAGRCRRDKAGDAEERVGARACAGDFNGVAQEVGYTSDFSALKTAPVGADYERWAPVTKSAGFTMQ